MNRETIIGALFSKLTGPPLVVAFTADLATGSATLTNVSNPTGLMVGMPVAGDGVSDGATIATVSPAVTLSLPAIADRTASPLLQGFQTTARRLRDPAAEQDMPALYLVELNELHAYRGSTSGVVVELNCEAWIFTRVGADANAVPAAALNTLIDAVERALYPNGTHFRQTLGLNGIVYARIEGELQKDPGHSAQTAMAVIPIKIAAAQHIDNFPL
jgi:hypothetical protein